MTGIEPATVLPVTVFKTARHHWPHFQAPGTALAVRGYAALLRGLLLVDPASPHGDAPPALMFAGYEIVWSTSRLSDFTQTLRTHNECVCGLCVVRLHPGAGRWCDLQVCSKPLFGLGVTPCADPPVRAVQEQETTTPGSVGQHVAFLIPRSLRHACTTDTVTPR